MRQYEVIGFAAMIHSGRVALDPRQAAARAHAVEAVKGTAGVFEVTAPIQFKRGERFGYDGDIPKAMAGEVSAAKAPAAPEAPAKAAAKAPAKK